MKRLTAQQIHDLGPCGHDRTDNGKHYTLAQIKRLMVQVVGKRRMTITAMDILKARKLGLLSWSDFWWIIIKAHLPASEAQALLDADADPKADNSYALRWAAEYGHTEVVKLLIPVSDPKANNSGALRRAAIYGHTEIVKVLIPVSDPDDYGGALRGAARNGHTEIVKVLIPFSDPKAYNSGALWWAAEYGHTEVVKLLIPVSDPKANNSGALRRAAIYGRTEIARVLKAAIEKRGGE